LNWLKYLLVCLLFGASVAQADFPDFTELVRKSSPAVVNIRTSVEPAPRGQEQGGQEVPEMFRRFFRDRTDPPRPRGGAASGFILDSNGYILTNNHVVDGADEIIVALSDRRERVAKIVGQDPLSDIALLKIDETDLPFLEMGHSEAVEAGQWVIAIGSPFGFEHSVAAGIVSATGRSLPSRRDNYVPFIQTDVAINPGNSGGPLLDLNGKVIGINSQIFTRSGGSMGLSFAIPIDVAMEVVAQLKEYGEVSRGWLGVLIQPVDKDLAESFGLDRPAGALVTQVFADSPADDGGLREGDIILSFDGKAVDLSGDLPHLVGRAKVDSEVELDIVRHSKKQTLTVRIGRLNAGESDSPTVTPELVGNRLGLELTDLKDDVRRGRDRDSQGQGQEQDQFSQTSPQKGVLVSQVYPGAARDAGIRRGDIITEFDGESVQTVDQLSRLLENLPGEITVHARVVRDSRPQYLALKIPGS
jgi:serine protease Do